MKKFVAILLFYSSFVYSEVKITSLGPVHEAFVTKEQGEEVLQAIPERPPAPLHETEKAGKEGLEWIGGYWAWVEGMEDFVWVSGVLRKPPPGHKWVMGKWKEFGRRYVWAPGYWTDQEKVEKISVAPPPEVNELVPASSSDYFWARGYWDFSQEKGYNWKKGRWEKFSSWVYVPGHYLTTGSAFIFIPPYWDFSLDDRGELFANVLVPKEEREEVIFSPTEKVTKEQLIEKLFGTYPEYVCLMQHYLFKDPHYFLKRGVEPSWWKWQSFWTLPFPDHMWLFWWWSHPGYPAPSWMTEELKAEITPASKDLVKWMSYVPAPLQVTKIGVLTSAAILKAIRVVLKEHIAILPTNEKIKKQIFKEANANGLPSIREKRSKEKKETKIPTQIPLKPSHTLPLDLYPSKPTRMILPPYPKEETAQLEPTYEEVAQLECNIPCPKGEVAQVNPQSTIPYPMEVDKRYPSSFPPDARYYNKQRMEGYNYYEEKNAELRTQKSRRNQNERGYFDVPDEYVDPFDTTYPQDQQAITKEKKANDQLLPPKAYRYTDRNYYSQPYRPPRRYSRFEGNRGPEPVRPLELQHRDYIQSQPQDNLSQ